MTPGPEVWVFHRGALGDSVLLWPRLRPELSAGRGVTLVTDRRKARLAERELGVIGVDAEQPRFNSLWLEGTAVEPAPRVKLVVCAGGGGDPTGAWGRNIGRAFPGAQLEVIGRPNRLLYRASDPASGIALRSNPSGPIVAHIGAGSETKRWPLARWAVVVDRLRAEGAEVAVIAGEVERERLREAERREFERLRGRFLDDLHMLADTIRAARVFVGGDSGPTHLAAAMGIPTVALFGPTDYQVWGPIGALVRVIAPASAQPMEWLREEEVLGALHRLESQLQAGLGR